MNFIAYILSIQNSDRRGHVKELSTKLLKLGFQVEIIDAIYWKEVDVLSILHDLHIELQNYNISQSQIACFLTHRKCWDIISKGNPNDISIILEDDMDVSEDLTIETLEKVYSSLQKNEYESIFLYKHPEQSSNISNLILQNEYLYKHYFQWGSCAYSITPKFADEFCKFIKCISKPVDEFLQIEFETKKDRIFYTVENYFINLGYVGGNSYYGEFKFQSLIWS